MRNPFNLFIATSVVLFLLSRVYVIVRESVTEVAPSAMPGNLRQAIVDGSLRAGGRLFVLLATALAISSAITIARHAPALLAQNAPAATEVVRLEPVTVSISAARFDAIRAEETAATRFAQKAAASKTS